MTHLFQDPSRSHVEDEVAVTGPPQGPDSHPADRATDRPSAWAVLDTLRNAAAAHDEDPCAFEVPESLRGQRS
jgi:hypothetical protein